MLQAERSSRFLPRAFSLHDQEEEDVSFLIAPVGPGSEELSQLDLGDRAFVLGPLGRGFETAFPGLSGRRLLLVAGGAGAAPFPLVMRSLSDPKAASAQELLVLLGFRDDMQAEVLHLYGEPAEVLRTSGTPVRVEAITEDGSLGRAGLVTTLLREEILPGDLVLACGAHLMCEAVWDLCLEAGVEAWFSLEAGMACGIGSCQGCVIEVADGSLAKVCRQGPVFSGLEAFGSQRRACQVAPP
jgi:dihydroorotate dehydrogenase electron transfer subunit